MANKPKSDRESEILTEARKRANEGLSVDAHNRREAINDLRMLVNEEHWTDGKGNDVTNERTDDGRPCLIFNRLPGFVDQVIGDMRANRPSAKIHPTDDKGTRETADLYEGIIRNIEAVSNADVAYDNGGEQAASSSFGAWRIITEYEDEESVDYQGARIRPIYNQFAVIWDSMSQEWDRSDAEWVMLLSKIHKDVYKEKYKGRTPKSFEVQKFGPNWYVGDTYTICEYFRREHGAVKKTIYRMPTEKAFYDFIDGLETPEEQEALRMMVLRGLIQYEAVVEELPEGLKEIWPRMVKADVGKERKIREQKIVRYLLSGHEILEDRQKWVSNKYWPIISVDGKVTNVDGKIYRRSVIRNAKDAQKAYNFSRNTDIEHFALAPKAPFIVTPEQIAGFESMWDSANKKTYAYLYYNRNERNPNEPPPQRVAPPQTSTAITQSTMMAVDEMRATTNVFEPGMEQPKPDMSGKAILARVSRSGVSNYSYLDNLGRAIALTWRTLIDIIPKIYDTERMVRIRKLDGTAQTVSVNKPNDRVAIASGAAPIINDLTLGKYDVAVTIGPSYATQRMEAADNMLQMVKAIPQTAPILGDAIIRNMDWHGAQEMAQRMKVWMFKQGLGYLFKPEDLQEIMKQIQGAPPQPPNPLMIAKLKSETAKAAKLLADAEKSLAMTGQIKAETGMQLMQLLQQLGMMAMMPLPQPGQTPQGQPPGQLPPAQGGMPGVM